MAEAFPLSGSIDPRAFPFLIAHLHRQGATGSLKVDGPSYQKAVYFRAGRVLFGSSNDPKDQLGAILIESGRISPEQFEEVNAKVGPGNPLAKVLSDSGFVSQRELSEAARTKVERIVSDVLSYDTGSFEFEDGVLPKGAVDLKLSSEKLFLAAARRISDRNFVLRHLEGLDVVLAPTGEMVRVIGEIEPDAGPAPRLFDGQRTLKDVAAEARIDEFEAAKVACALLFLGAIEKKSAELFDLGAMAREAVEPASPPPDATLLLGDDSPALDLGFSSAAPESAPILPDSEPEPAPLFSAEPEPVAVPEPQPEPEPAGFAIVEPQAEPEPATILMAPTPEPEPVPPPPPPRVPVSAPPPPPVDMSPSPSLSFEEEPPPPVASAPPSKEDLAALDALLNARHVEGPLAPMEKRAEPDWEPHFGQGRGKNAAGRSSRRTLLGVIAALVLVAGGAAAYVFLRPGLTPGGPASPQPGVPATTQAPATTLAATDTTLPAPATTAPAGTLAPAPTTVAARPTPAPPTTVAARPTPAPPATTAPAGRPAGGLGEAREAFKRGEYRASARSFEQNLRAAKGGYTIQILVACSDETLQKAQQNVPAPELFIVPVNYQGKSCYRLLWGLFESESRAQSAVAQVPRYFRENGAKPKAVSGASILP
jgi:hypothetical protein